MFETIALWCKKIDTDDKLVSKVTDLNTVTCLIFQIFLCIVLLLHILFLIVFPIVIGIYVSKHDESFCKVLCSRTKGFCSYVGEATKQYYYPMAVIEEEVDYVGEIDYKERARSNKEFGKQEKIDDFIEERRKYHKSFNDVECPGCEKEIEDNEEVVDLDCNSGHTYHIDCLREQL